MRNLPEKILISICAVLAPIKAIILTVGVLILFDFITGLMAARKRGETITSAGMRRSVSKLVIYQIAVITGFLVETYMLSDMLPVTKFVAAIIGLVELTSIFENINTVYGSNLFGAVIDKLGSVNQKKKKK